MSAKSKGSSTSNRRIVVTQVRSGIGQRLTQKQTLKSLGLGRIGKSVDHPANTALLGMIKTVSHLVVVKQG